MLAIDPLVGLPPSIQGGHRYAHVVTNPATHRIRVYPNTRNRTREWVNSLRAFMIDSGLQVNDAVYGPRVVQSDQDPAAMSAEMAQFLRDIGAKPRHSAPHAHGQNFWVEGQIRVVWQMTTALPLRSGN